MCGIAAYLGSERSVKFLIGTLKKLEYRGYDSAGYAKLEDGKFVVKKKSGSIKNLEQQIDDNETASLAISHTRWATHGEPNETNAHPHISTNKTWAVVHNGIIENYLQIKKDIGASPESETDTAVVAELLDVADVSNIFEFIDEINDLKGSFALACICSEIQDTMFLAKEKSPLYVAESNGDFLVASDPICFSGFSKDYYSFDDGEFAQITKEKIEFFDKNKNQVSKTKIILEDVFEETDKGEFSHFMIKEIHFEKQALLCQAQTFENGQILKNFGEDFIDDFDEVKFIGCGTAYHAGLMGAKFVEKILGLKASAEIASEFIYFEPSFISSKTLYIFVSQSGETADTLRALELVKKSGAATIALTNVLYSSVAKKAEYVLPICAGVEIAVASTKAYVNMLSAIYLFCKYFCGQKYFEKAVLNIKKLAEQILNFDTNQLDQIAENFALKKEAIFIGKDMDYITALEASLKLKEVGYINASVYPSGELKHGFLALVESGTPLVVFALQNGLVHKTLSSANEAVCRGAKVLMVSNNTDCKFDDFVFVQEEDEFLRQIKAIVPLQYLAFKVSTIKGINPDQPRNLAKSVTVE